MFWLHPRGVAQKNIGQALANEVRPAMWQRERARYVPCGQSVKTTERIRGALACHLSCHLSPQANCAVSTGHFALLRRGGTRYR